MAELKTKPNKKSVQEFIASIESDEQREDALVLLKLFSDLTKEKPVIWGDSIIGFGQYHYKYNSGQEGDWPLTGFSPRKQNISIYIMPGFKNYGGILEKLGKFKVSKGSCLYIKKLEDIDTKILSSLIKKSVADMKKIYNVK